MLADVHLQHRWGRGLVKTTALDSVANAPVLQPGVSLHNPELEVVVYTPLPDSDTLRKLQQLRDLHRLEKFLLKS